MPERRRKRRRRRKSTSTLWLKSAGTMLKTVSGYGILVFLIIFPLAMGGGAPWGPDAACAWIALMVSLYLIGAGASGEFTVIRTKLYIPLAVLVGIGLFQLVPLGDLVTTLAPTSAERWQAAADSGLTEHTARVSLAPRETSAMVLALISSIGVIFLLTANFASRSGVILLGGSIFLAGVINAVLGFAPLFGKEKGWFWYFSTNDTMVRGTFLNRNHFACLMGISLLIGSGLLTALLKERERTDLDRGNPWPTKPEPLIIGVMLGLMVMGCALIFSLSRGGVASVSLAWIAYWFWVFRRQRGNARHLWSMAVPFVGAFFFATSYGVEKLSGRYDDALSAGNIGMLGRWTIWTDAVSMVPDYLFFGVGLGGFPYASPMYESGWLPDSVAWRAHNDWLELALEVGLPIALLVGGACLYGLVRLYKTVRRRQDTLYFSLGLATLCSLTAVALHECLEFNLRAPGLFFVLIAVTSLAVLTMHLKRTASGTDSPQTSLGPRWARAGLVGVGLCIVISGSLFLPERIRAGLSEETLLRMTSPQAPASQLTSAGRTRYLKSLSTSILKKDPGSPAALKILARLDANRAVSQWESEAPESAPEATDQAIAASLLSAAEYARQLSNNYPTVGQYQSLYAAISEQSMRFSDTKTPDHIAAATALAQKNAPHIGSVLEQCGGVWLNLYDFSISPNDTYKLNALSAFRDAVDQNPALMGSVLDRMLVITREPEQLRALAPDRLSAYDALYQFYLSNGMIEACEPTLDAMDQLNKKRPTMADSDRLNVSDMARLDRRSRAEVDADILRRRVFLAGMTGNWTQRNQFLTAMATANDMVIETKLATILELAKSGQSERAELRLKSALFTQPDHPRLLLEYADILRQKGDFKAARPYLLRLVYDPDRIDAPAHLKRSLDLVEACFSFSSQQDGAPADVRGLFLKGALLYQLGRVTSDQTNLQDAETALATAAAALSKQGDQSWFQTPLVLYYYGRVLEARNRPDAAGAAYLEALKTCPGHWYSALRLRDLITTGTLTYGSDTMTKSACEAAVSWLKELPVAVPLQSRFGGTLTLLGYAVEPAVIHGYEPVQLSATWLCRGDMDRDYSMSLHFALKGQPLFSGRAGLSKGEISMINLRVGEVMEMVAGMKPAHQVYRRGQTLPNGLSDVTISLSGPGGRLAPEAPARGPAFVLGE